MTVKVEGLAKLARELKAIGTGLDKELRAVGKDAAELVADETQSRAPVLTGRLRNSVKAGVAGNTAFVKTGASLPYAKPIVFGWRRHNISPNPFPYEALDARRQEVIDRYSKGVHDLVEKTITKGTGG